MEAQMRPKLTYANVVATLALFIAIGGASAFAASQLGKNSVGPKQLKKNAVTTAKIKNEALTAAKVKKGTLTGTQINASTLGTVPDASHARSADHATGADHASSADTVGGLSVIKFEQAGPVSGASPVTVVSLGGLQLEYSCDEVTDSLAFRATTSVDGASIWLSRTNSVNTQLESKEPFDSGESFPLVGFLGTGVYTAPGGRVVTFTYRNTLHCKSGVAGTAYGG
jgi:hypothetical protein